MQVEKLRTVDADTLLSTPLRKTLFVVEGLIPRAERIIGRKQDRQKLADAVAWYASGKRKSRVGI